MAVSPRIAVSLAAGLLAAALASGPARADGSGYGDPSQSTPPQGSTAAPASTGPLGTGTAAGVSTAPASTGSGTDALRSLVAVQSAELDALRDTVAQMKADLARVSAACASGTSSAATAAAGTYVTLDQFNSYTGEKGCILHRYLQSGPPTCPDGYQVVAAFRGLVAAFGDDGTSFTSGPADRTLCCK